MRRLNIGQQVKLETGDEVIIIDFLGEGGQGIVYKVRDRQRNEFALKWYKEPDDWLYQNIRRLIERGKPSEEYLWPIAVTEKIDHHFGYLMDLLPPGYKSILKGKEVVDFSSFKNPVLSKLNAALKIVKALKILHREGYVFYDLNEGGFFINPENGNILITDCDNVSPVGEAKIVGMTRYKAPEIVEGETSPNRYTDYFSLAILLFILLYGNHPFEGSKFFSYTCQTEEADKEIYGKNSVFMFDPNDSSNHPVKGLNNNALRWWRFYPKRLNAAFQRAFSKDAIQNPQHRLNETQWIKVLSRVRDLLVRCQNPSCKEETFARKQCYFCQNKLEIPYALQIENRKIPLVKGKILYTTTLNIFTNDDDIFKPIGKVLKNKKNGKIGIKNLSDHEWSTIKNGQLLIINKNDILILEKGQEVRFSNNSTGQII